MSNPADQGMLPDHVRNDMPPHDGPDEPTTGSGDRRLPPDDPAAEHIDPDIDPRTDPRDARSEDEG